MEKVSSSPWPPHEAVRAARCWACHAEFAEADAVRVVDSVDPKLVHDRAPCANAMVQFTVGSTPANPA